MKDNKKKNPLSKVTMRPSDILFSFGKIENKFSGCGRTLEETLEDLCRGKISYKDISPITVVRVEVQERTCYDDDSEDDDDNPRREKRERKKNSSSKNTHPVFVSMNNRRLWVFQEAERRKILDFIEVRVQNELVSERLVRKGSRNFRLDRVTKEARIVPAMRNRKLEPEAANNILR